MHLLRVLDPDAAPARTGTDSATGNSALPNAQVCLVRVQQISHLLLVNFDKAGHEKELAGGRGCGDCVEHVGECSGSDAPGVAGGHISYHRVRLAAASLTIDKHGAIEAVQEIVHDAARCLVIHISLRSLGREHRVKCENGIA